MRLDSISLDLIKGENGWVRKGDQRDEGRDGEDEAYSNRMKRVLGKEHTLKLDDEEVDQLLDVLERGFQGFAGNGVVAFGTERGG